MIEKLATFGGRQPGPGPLKKTMKGPPGSGLETPKKLARFGTIKDRSQTPKKTIKGIRGIPPKKAQKVGNSYPISEPKLPPSKKPSKPKTGTRQKSPEILARNGGKGLGKKRPGKKKREKSGDFKKPSKTAKNLSVKKHQQTDLN